MYDNQILNFKDMKSLDEVAKDILLEKPKQQPALHDAEPGDEIEFEIRKGVWTLGIVKKWNDAKKKFDVKSVDSGQVYELDPNHPTRWPIDESSSFKDMQVVDYTFSDGTNYDPDGILSRMAKKRKGEIGGGPVEP